FIGNPTGAWGLGYSNLDAISEDEKLDAAKKAFVYNYFKYWASPQQSSDDCSIKVQAGARDTRVEGNLLNGGLQGISFSHTREIVVVGNTIHRFSSIGIASSSGSYRMVCDGNVFSDCNINIRLHRLNEPGRREI